MQHLLFWQLFWFAFSSSLFAINIWHIRHCSEFLLPERLHLGETTIYPGRPTVLDLSTSTPSAVYCLSTRSHDGASAADRSLITVTFLTALHSPHQFPLWHSIATCPNGFFIFIYSNINWSKSQLHLSPYIGVPQIQRLLQQLEFATIIISTLPAAVGAAHHLELTG